MRSENQQACLSVAASGTLPHTVDLGSAAEKQRHRQRRETSPTPERRVFWSRIKD